jgi:hypothetical protein
MKILIPISRSQIWLTAQGMTTTERRAGRTPPTESLGIVHPLERARAELTLERYAAAVARGRETPIDEIVQVALAVAAGALDRVGGILDS